MSIVLISIRFEIMRQMQKSEERRRKVKEKRGPFIVLVFNEVASTRWLIKIFCHRKGKHFLRIGQESDPSDLSDLSDGHTKRTCKKNSFLVNNALFICDFVKNDEIIYCFLLILQIK